MLQELKFKHYEKKNVLILDCRVGVATFVLLFYVRIMN